MDSSSSSDELSKSLLNTNTEEINNTPHKIKMEREAFVGRTSTQSNYQTNGTSAPSTATRNLAAAGANNQGRQSIAEFANRDFYKEENWVYNAFDILFKLKRRETTISSEVWCGVLHFVSCMYCLAVIPQQLGNAGYNPQKTVVAVAACSGVGSILGGLFANLPFVLAPPTVVSIFLSVYLQGKDLGPQQGNMAVVASGIALMAFGYKPLAQLASRLIPVSIQVGTAVGIGLLTALAGATEIDLVVPGKYTILEIGPIHAKVIITIAGVILICIANNYKIKGSFALSVIVCSLVWWIDTDSFPTKLVELPTWERNPIDEDKYNAHIPVLVNEILFLYVLYLNGLVSSLSDLAHLTRDDGSAPRGRWIYIMSGLFTVMGGLLTSAPILVSPESAAGIKAGAKTGLSAVVCGILFLVSIMFAPLFKAVPAAGTSPVLIMIGIVLFQNANRIDWRNPQNAAPGFVTLFFIPMTYSIIQGVIIGYIVFITVALFSGDLLIFFVDFMELYFPGSTGSLHSYVHNRRRAQSAAAMSPSFDEHVRKPSVDSVASKTSTMSSNMYHHESDHPREGRTASVTGLSASDMDSSHFPAIQDAYIQDHGRNAEGQLANGYA